MIPVEALKIALSKEIEAIQLYQNFYKEHPQLQETLMFLITEEEKHKQLLEKKIYELTR